MKLRNFARLTAAALMALALLPAEAYGWNMAKVSIKSKFANDVSPTNALPEYPRPQMVRTDWMNLNGIWDFSYLPRYEEDIPDEGFQEILVPYCTESALSGIKARYESMAYRRNFTLPADWGDKRVLLNFEAVDWRCTVYVNGNEVGSHDGGYDPFSFDVTQYVKAGQLNTVALKVFDPSDRWSVPRGKQVRNPGGIFYTTCSGIWQTVWLEAVPQTYISDFRITPDIDAQTLTVNAKAAGTEDEAAVVKAIAYHGSTKVAEAVGKPGEDIVLQITNPDLWTPDHPYLYDLKLQLTDKNGKTDDVDSYFGMRKINLAKDKDGFIRMMLNNEFVFQTGPLDQGYWPESNLTPPTDEAMQFDIVQMKKYGFNMVRKHITVEPRRWYYWTDKLGLLVWQDMPSMNYGGSKDAGVTNDANMFTPELTAMINTHYNTPSIVNWVIFNEAGGQHDTKKYVDLVRQLDPTRLIDEASGWTHYGYGDIKDTHPYPAPSGVPQNGKQATANGEFGGIKLAVDGHLWSGSGWGYASVESPAAFDSIISNYFNKLAYYKTYQGLSASVYTQITDVEIEVNGLMTYDRIPKSDMSKLYAANRRLIERDGIEEDYILPTANIAPQSWKYTFTNPGTDYYKPDFDDSSWKIGNSGFGANGLANMTYGTRWTSSDIWLRKTVDLNLTAEELAQLRMTIYNDEDVQIYINGVLAYTATGYLTDYKTVDISKNAREAMNPQGANVIAIHVKQTAGGQFIDLGLQLDKPVKDLPVDRVVQLNMDYTKSSELSFEVGYSLDPEATEPDQKKSFTRLTFADGEANYIGINDGALLTPKTVQLDITDLTASVPAGATVKYFIYVKPQTCGEGEGTVYNCAVIDYTQDPAGAQTPMTIDPVEISHETGTVLLSASASSDAFNAPRNATITNGELKWDAPLITTAVLQSYKVYENGEAKTVLPKTTRSYTITDPSAIYAVAAVYSTGTSELSNSAKAPITPTRSANMARYFDGGGFSCPAVFSKAQPNATIEYWFKPDTLLANSQQVGPGWGSFLITYDQFRRVTAGYQNTTTQRVQSTSSAITNGKWNHVAVTIDGNRLMLYIDGAPKRTMAVQGSSGMPAIEEFVFGSNGAFLQGWIDDVRIWKSARTFDEIQSDMTAELLNPSAEQDLLAYYKMDEIDINGVTKLRDSAHGNHASYLNTTTTTLAQDTTILNGEPAPMSADFAFADTAVVAGSEIMANAMLNSSVVAWKWAEPTTKLAKTNLQSVSLVFPKAGEYEVSLTAYDVDGKSTEVSHTIQVLPVELPTVDFDIYQPDRTAGSLITLINKSAGVNTTYKWQLPYSTTDQNQEVFNASASYAKDGIYQVTLTATNPAGSVSVSKNIEVSSGVRSMVFAVEPNVIVPGEPVNLLQDSEAAAENLVWTISNDKNRTLILGGSTTYKPTAVGRYDITLTDSETGSSSTVKDALLVCAAKSKTGLFFRNAQEALVVPSPFTAKTTKFTVEWWMKPNMTLNAGAMATGNGAFAIATDGAGSMTVTVGNKKAITPDGFVIPNEWHHYAITLAGSRVTVLRDGEAFATAYPLLSSPAWDDLVIGGSQGSMSATIDELRIWGAGLKDDVLKTVCNAPVADVAAAQSANALKVYYDFNNVSTTVADLTTNGLNATLQGFHRYTANNYIPSDGVFSLGINTPSSIDDNIDITAKYLTNYKSEFLHTDQLVNPDHNVNLYALQTGTKTSTWQGNIATATEPGVFVDGQNKYGFTYTTTWAGLAENAIDQTAYQTIILPAGVYRFSAQSTVADNTSDCMLVATMGESLANFDQLATTLASAPLNSGMVEFTLPKETEVSLGVLYNLPAYSSSVISGFTLTQLPCEIINANLEDPTGVSDAATTDNLAIEAADGAIKLQGQNAAVRIHTIDGKLIIATTINGATTISLPAGIYIVNGSKLQVK